MPVRVKVLFFGMLKDIVGAAEDTLEVGDGAAVGQVFEHYARLYPKLGEMRKSILLARNQEFSRDTEPLSDGDEVALMPPVSGGAPEFTHVIERDGNFFALTRGPIDTRGLARRVLRRSDGAVTTFEGVARDNTGGRPTQYLDYECYEPMAIKVMAELGCEIARTHEIGRLAIVHRLGRVAIGETSVAIVAAAPHRKAAFQAAMEAIDRLKRTVPIWKKETFADGEVWVEGEWDDSVIAR
ncbi:MAG TPA: molybdopterin converting factor subunit 1 [Bryobacteraceae bacterium]|nr:molybdopterin converting factor subunit 1 [Bryobacteraceae bacterium]HOQ45529.1 molybdopterin converting factor subunit 1 [Bryobacteraceae bacterium]HPQ17194.1 molybdopterin converting factor subunit 1 [Bryobacteraceae bacterium]HPU73433.1 molybdopterin converting factor subunit 1 [Bryobacteraceae bacterium]